MPRLTVDRARAFVFYPEFYLDDPAVRRMGVMGRGAYGGALLPALWNQPEPGVVEADDDLLASLAMCSPEEWAAVRDKVSRAFDTTSRPGYWVQKRMVAQHAAYQQEFRRQSAASIAANNIRWHKGKRPARIRLGSDADPEGDCEGDREEQESTPARTRAIIEAEPKPTPRPNGNGARQGNGHGDALVTPEEMARMVAELASTLEIKP